jgi:hypothetical protein
MISCSGLARTPHGPVAGKRARPHSESRSKRRRHVLQRPAAIDAGFLGSSLHAEPVTTRGTPWTQALNRITGQMLHPIASRKRNLAVERGSALTAKHVHQKRRNQAKLCSGRSSVSSGISTISRGGLPKTGKRLDWLGVGSVQPSAETYPIGFCSQLPRPAGLADRRFSFGRRQSPAAYH